MLLPAPPLAPRDAARVDLCASVPSRFAQSPKRCSALVPGLPAVLRPPRERLVPRLERHESGAAGLRAERLPARSRESAPCLLRSRDARSKPAPCSSHFMLASTPASPQTPRSNAAASQPRLARLCACHNQRPATARAREARPHMPRHRPCHSSCPVAAPDRPASPPAAQAPRSNTAAFLLRYAVVATLVQLRIGSIRPSLGVGTTGGDDDVPTA